MSTKYPGMPSVIHGNGAVVQVMGQVCGGGVGYPRSEDKKVGGVSITLRYPFPETELVAAFKNTEDKAMDSVGPFIALVERLFAFIVVLASLTVAAICVGLGYPWPACLCTAPGLVAIVRAFVRH